MQVLLLLLGRLHLVPDDICVFQTSWGSTYPCLLHWGADKVLLQECWEPLGHHTEENLSFHIQKTDLSELIDGWGILLFGNHPSRLSLSLWYNSFFPCHFHQSPEAPQDTPHILLEPIWNVAGPRGWGSSCPHYCAFNFAPYRGPWVGLP